MVLKCKGNCGKILNPNLNKSGYCTSCRFKNPDFKKQRHKYYEKYNSNKYTKEYQKQYRETHKEYFKQYQKDYWLKTKVSLQNEKQSLNTS